MCVALHSPDLAGHLPALGFQELAIRQVAGLGHRGVSQQRHDAIWEERLAKRVIGEFTGGEIIVALLLPLP
jgi:hypothetical protein